MIQFFSNDTDKHKVIIELKQHFIRDVILIGKIVHADQIPILI